MAQTKPQRLADGDENLARRNRKKLLPKAAADDAVTEVGDAVEHKDPHAEEMPLQSVLRPFADHDGIGKTQKAEQNVVVVDLPAAADHDEDRQRIDPVHDAHWQRMQAARCNRFRQCGRLCRLWHRQLRFDTEPSQKRAHPALWRIDFDGFARVLRTATVRARYHTRKALRFTKPRGHFDGAPLADASGSI